MTAPPDSGGGPDQSAPPVGEEVHLPGPTLLPLVNAFGTTLAVVGIVISWWITAAGVVIFVWSTLRWIADTRRDIAELPLDHH